MSLSDPAAILYSSGTTGMVKGALLTQRNLVAAVAGGHAVRAARSRPAVVLCTVPYFHSYGFTCCLRSLGMGESLVCMGKFDFGRVLKAVEEFRVSHVVLAPPVVLRMARDGGTMGGYDLSSIEVVASGGAHLTLSVIRKFKERLPKVNLAQVSSFGFTSNKGGECLLSPQFAPLQDSFSFYSSLSVRKICYKKIQLKLCLIFYTSYIKTNSELA